MQKLNIYRQLFTAKNVRGHIKARSCTLSKETARAPLHNLWNTVLILTATGWCDKHGWIYCFPEALSSVSHPGWCFCHLLDPANRILILTETSSLYSSSCQTETFCLVSNVSNVKLLQHTSDEKTRPAQTRSELNWISAGSNLCQLYNSHMPVQLTHDRFNLN